MKRKSFYRGNNGILMRSEELSTRRIGIRVCAMPWWQMLWSAITGNQEPVGIASLAASQPELDASKCCFDDSKGLKERHLRSCPRIHDVDTVWFLRHGK